MKRIKLSTFHQVESAECGAASLKILLDYYDSRITIETAKQAIGIGRDGSSGRDICRASSEFGLTLLPLMVSFDEVKSELEAPYIMFWGRNHWLVVEGFKNGYLYVSDPAKGNVRYPEEFAHNYFSGLVLIPSNFNESFRRSEQVDPNINLYSLFSSYFPSIVFNLILAIVSLIPEIAFALSLGVFTENIATNSIDQSVLSQAWLLSLLSGMFIGFLILRLSILRLINKNLFLRASRFSITKLISAPILFYALRSTGELADRVARLTSFANDTTANFIPGIFNVARATTALGILFIIDFRIATFALTIFLLSSIVVLQLAQTSIRDSAVNETYLSKCLGILVDIIRSSELVKSTGTESMFFQNWAGNFAQYISSSQGVAIVNANISTIIQMSTYGLSIGILFISAFLIMDGSLNLAAYTAFLYLTTIVTESLSSLTSALSSFSSISGFKWRLNDTSQIQSDPFSSISNYHLPVDDSELRAHENDLSTVESTLKVTSEPIDQTNTASLINQNPDLQINGLEFSFPGTTNPVFSNIDYSFANNSITSIIGPSGSGKSTLAKIISGLIPPTAGNVTLGEHTLLELGPSLSLSLVSYVPQDSFLFEGSLLDNLLLFDDTINQSSIDNAIRKTDLLNRLSVPRDMKSFRIKERGTNLSGGQRQLVELTRALVRDPTYIILDEATSGFDNKLERFVFESLSQSNLSIISIAHRKTALDFSNQILDLANYI